MFFDKFKYWPFLFFPVDVTARIELERDRQRSFIRYKFSGVRRGRPQSDSSDARCHRFETSRPIRLQKIFTRRLPHSSWGKFTREPHRERGVNCHVTLASHQSALLVSRIPLISSHCRKNVASLLWGPIMHTIRVQCLLNFQDRLASMRN